MPPFLIPGSNPPRTSMADVPPGTLQAIWDRKNKPSSMAICPKSLHIQSAHGRMPIIWAEKGIPRICLGQCVPGGYLPCGYWGHPAENSGKRNPAGYHRIAEKIPLPGSTRKQGRLVYRGITDIFEPGILPGSLLERRSGLTKWGKGGCWDAGIQGIVWSIWRKLSE